MNYVMLMAGMKGNIALYSTSSSNEYSKANIINRISSGIQYALFILFTVCTFFFIDFTGRRVLLIYGAIGMGVCHFVVGGLLGTYSYPVPEGIDGNANVSLFF
jgi:hypothetical protein